MSEQYPGPEAPPTERKSLTREDYHPETLSTRQAQWLEEKMRVENFSTKNLTEEELETQGLIRIEVRGACKLVDKEQAELMQSECKKTLHNRKNGGYIDAIDVTDLDQGSKLEHIVSFNDLKKIRERIKLWKQSEFPIFDRDLYRYHEFNERRRIFPVIEYVILFSTKKLGEHFAKNLREGKNPIHHLGIPDVEFFLKNVFTEKGVFDPQIRNHLLRHAEQDWNFENQEDEYFAKENIQKTILMLEEISREKTQNERTYIPWDGTKEIILAASRDSAFWYQNYSPQDRERIVRAFMNKPQLPSKTEEAKIALLRALFPELINGLLGERAFHEYRNDIIKGALRENIETLHLGAITPSTIGDLERYPDLQLKVKDLMLQKARQINKNDLGKLFTATNNFLTHIGLPSSQEPWIVHAVDEIRVTVAETLTNDELTGVNHRIFRDTFGPLFTAHLAKRRA